jgi:signal transduction histidine kinase
MILTMDARRPTEELSTMRPPDVPPPVASAGATTSTDYYDPAWGALVRGQGVDESEEPWVRQLPAMRVYGFVVLAVALVAAYPRHDPGGWRGPATLAGIAALSVAYWIMWVRRPIWAYPTRTLAAHGIFQLAAYAAMVGISPSFAVLQLVVFPQVVFSLPIRWSIAGGVFLGAITSGAILAASSGGFETALPWVFYELLATALVIAFAVWMRQEIAQSMERRALIEQLQTARRDLAAAEREAAVAEERARFAREIHDTLAQGFASVVTHLEAADACLDADARRARRDVRAAAEVARASLADARTLVWALRPETIATAGLPAAIERVAAAAGGVDGPAVEVTISGQPRALHPEVEVTLLRAAQEALANARRHARAAHVTLTLTYFADEVSLDVTDDGCGFDPALAGMSGGMGLLGMRERVEGLEGRLAIESAPGEGTAVAVTLPAIEPPVPVASRPVVAASVGDGVR